MRKDVHWVLVFDHSGNIFHKIHLTPEQVLWAKRFKNEENFVKKLCEDYPIDISNISFLLMDELNEIDYDI